MGRFPKVRSASSWKTGAGKSRQTRAWGPPPGGFPSARRPAGSVDPVRPAHRLLLQPRAAALEAARPPPGPVPSSSPNTTPSSPSQLGCAQSSTRLRGGGVTGQVPRGPLLNWAAASAVTRGHLTSSPSPQQPRSSGGKCGSTQTGGASPACHPHSPGRRLVIRGSRGLGRAGVSGLGQFFETVTRSVRSSPACTTRFTASP